MKILTIRLHPFGGVAARTCTMADGLNVLEGPNEFGKSTLTQALWHALFTPTNLTPGKMKSMIGRWYPKPCGDHSRVTLVIEAEGRTWTLKKTWGAGASSSLETAGGSAIADPYKVQEKVISLLRLNEATWRHVLFTGQAQLARTIEELAAKGGDIDDVGTLLRGAAAIPGDIPVDKLVAAIDGRIEKHFSHWDRGTNGPEDGRGIGNEWKKMVGPLLGAYYGMEKVRHDLEDVVRLEVEMDAVNDRINKLTKEIAVDEGFVVAGRSLRDGLSRREGAEERCHRLKKELNALKQVMTDWPGADQVIKGKNRELVGITSNLTSLETELNHARQRALAVQLRHGYQQLSSAKTKWDEAAANLKAFRPVDPALMEELRTLEQEIDKLRITIAAQKLSAQLSSGSQRQLNVQRGTEAMETLSLTPSGNWEGAAEGQIRIDLEDLSIVVQSGTGDVQGLFEKLKGDQLRHREILLALGHENLSAAEGAKKQYDNLLRDVEAKNSLYAAALQGHSEEKWEADMRALAALPQTRDIGPLEEEQRRLQSQEAALRYEIDQEQKKVAGWTAEHADLGALTDKVLANTGEFKSATQELDGLPELPEGYDSIQDYLKQLSARENDQNERMRHLQEAKMEHSRLTGVPHEQTAEELRAELESSEKVFERQQAAGQALVRIQTKLCAIVAKAGDPLKGLSSEVSRHFRDLTAGRYENVILKGSVPTGVNGPHPLETNFLSQGTLGSLALATRLALGELYLDGSDGFLLLDDPFIDMDAARRHAAAKAIGNFAANCQVLFFTCHKEHARELVQVSGAKMMQATDDPA